MPNHIKNQVRPLTHVGDEKVGSVQRELRHRIRAERDFLHDRTVAVAREQPRRIVPEVSRGLHRREVLQVIDDDISQRARGPSLVSTKRQQSEQKKRLAFAPPHKSMWGGRPFVQAGYVRVL